MERKKEKETERKKEKETERKKEKERKKDNDRGEYGEKEEASVRFFVVL